MKILHTSDWHAGRLWKNQNRLPELQDVLEHLGDFIERERIDLLLMSGDVFDSASPPAEAERAVSTFFKRIGRAGVPSVVIAGNHDHPTRLETWGLLAEFVGVQARGLPKRRSDGGLIELTTRAGEPACIAAVPFAPVGRIVDALSLARDETLARQQYAAAIQRIFAHLAEGFRASAVNLVVAHSHVAGAIPSGSERPVTLGNDWAATAQSIPPSAQYVALGHIHRPQRVESAGPHTEYAGSPLQLDFGEAGDEKTFAVVEAVPGRPPRVERVRYAGGKELKDWAGTLAQLERDADCLKAFGYVRLRVTLDTPLPDLNRRARQLLPNVVVVEAALPEAVVNRSTAPADAVAPADQFRAFYIRQHQREPREETTTLFNELHSLASVE